MQAGLRCNPETATACQKETATAGLPRVRGATTHMHAYVTLSVALSHCCFHHITSSCPFFLNVSQAAPTKCMHLAKEIFLYYFSVTLWLSAEMHGAEMGEDGEVYHICCSSRLLNKMETEFWGLRRKLGVVD